MSRIRKKFHPWLIEHATLLGAYRSLAALIAFPLILVGAPLAFLNIRDRLSLPDVELDFVRPTNVSFSVVNTSSAVAPEPKYELVLFDFGSRMHPPERPKGLQIPSKIVDTMRPHSGLGPWSVASISGGAGGGGFYDDHSRIFGFATVSCPLCERARAYLVYFEIDRGGWFVELPADKTQTVRELVGHVLSDPASLEQTLEVEAPPGSRRMIR